MIFEADMRLGRGCWKAQGGFWDAWIYLAQPALPKWGKTLSVYLKAAKIQRFDVD